MMDVIEITASILIIGLIAKFIAYVLGFLNLMLPSILYKFIFVALAISVVQYIIGRKDD